MELAVRCIECDRALMAPEDGDVTPPVCFACWEVKQPELTRAKHGHARNGNHSPEHKAWQHMRDRCRNPRNQVFALYGGRGIKVCERWESSFEAFLADMGLRPSNRHSLDRIDNNGNYEPSNCRWATTRQQARNNRGNRLITHNGQTMCLTEWAERMGMKTGALRQRLLNGWTVEDALTFPVLRGWRYADRKAAA